MRLAIPRSLPRIVQPLAYLPWRAPRIEAGPVRLTARRLYVLPTRAGLVFGLLLLGLLLGAMNYSLSLAYLFTFLLAGIGLAGMIHTHRNLLGLSVRAGPTAPVFAGETARFRLHLDNPSRLERFDIVIEHPEGISNRCDLPAGGQAELCLALPQPRRGEHRPGRFALATRYPLGLFRCWTVLELDWSVLVYPRPADEAQAFPLGAGNGEGSTGQRPGTEEFDGLRDYQPGDSPRRIAWKASARRDQPVTKAFDAPSDDDLWLNWQDASEPDTEARLSRLTRWLLDAEAAGLAWGLRLPNGQTPLGRGEAHRSQGLERLARFGE